MRVPLGALSAWTIDALSTQVIDGTLVKIYAWYDNEAGYSKRMAELCNIVANRYIAGEEESFKYEWKECNISWTAKNMMEWLVTEKSFEAILN